MRRENNFINLSSSEFSDVYATRCTGSNNFGNFQ